MATTWDVQGEAQAGLRAIVADPRYGPAALSNAQTMTNLLKDMLPDAPRESSVLVQASDAGVADMLQTHISNGMDLATASRLAAGSFENQTGLTPEACNWAVGAFASALRLDTVRQAPPPPVQDTGRPVSNGQQTVKAPVVGAGTVTPAPEAPVQPNGLRIAAAAVAAVAAILLIWACALTFEHFSGENSFSFFSIAGLPSGTWWPAIGSVAVAVLGLAAAVLLLATRTPLMRGLAAGMLLAFGVAQVLAFATYWAVYGTHPAQTVGTVGGLLLVIAGVLALVGPKTSRA